ncbi:hypothetical protein FRB96_001526 [Tulasnella sp. 330]|nr:hypothetical protein FRB96_001526 [Tulasnella sp. 330]KAG8886604.1 hypothetical protein FRB97_000023 [Tulasnella sp. 331]KAG8890703.1 hypothetical protein FRB98_006207 [Tulasnella sp. 332]
MMELLRQHHEAGMAKLRPRTPCGFPQRIGHMSECRAYVGNAVAWDNAGRRTNNYRNCRKRLGDVNVGLRINVDGSARKLVYPKKDAKIYGDPPLNDGSITETGYYIPISRCDPTFYSFFYDSNDKTATFRQVTVGKAHTVNMRGPRELERITPKGTELTYLAVVSQDLEMVFAAPKDWKGNMTIYWTKVMDDQVMNFGT